MTELEKWATQAANEFMPSLESRIRLPAEIYMQQVTLSSGVEIGFKLGARMMRNKCLAEISKIPEPFIFDDDAIHYAKDIHLRVQGIGEAEVSGD